MRDKMLCLLIILSATAAYCSNYGDYHNYMFNYHNYRSRNYGYQPNYYNVRENMLELGVCQKFCYGVNCYGEIEWKCCDFNEKEGSCPANCLFLGNKRLNFRNIHCTFDSECPPDYKCCTDACYRGGRICKRSVRIPRNCPVKPPDANTRATTLNPTTIMSTQELTRATELRTTTTTRATEPTTTELRTTTIETTRATEPTTTQSTTRIRPATIPDDEDYEPDYGSGSGDGDTEVESPVYEDDPVEIPPAQSKLPNPNGDRNEMHSSGDKNGFRKDVEIIAPQKHSAPNILESEDEFNFFE